MSLSFRLVAADVATGVKQRSAAAEATQALVTIQKRSILEPRRASPFSLAVPRIVGARVMRRLRRAGLGAFDGVTGERGVSPP